MSNKNKEFIPEEGSISNMNNPRIAIQTQKVGQGQKNFIKTNYKESVPMNPEEVNLNINAGKKQMTQKEARDARMKGYNQNLMAPGTQKFSKGGTTAIKGVMVNAYDKPDFEQVNQKHLRFLKQISISLKILLNFCLAAGTS